MATKKATATAAQETNRVFPNGNGSAKAKDDVKLVIPQPKVQVLEISIRGIAPLVIRAWDQKTMQQLADKAKTGVTVRNREKVDPDETYNSARYVSPEGWDGFPAGGFRAAMIDAVSCVDIAVRDFNMTLAKKCLFVIPDGICKVSGRDLVRIEGQSERFDLMQPTSGGGPYMSYRPIYRKWSATLKIQFNAARLNAQGVLNLVSLAGFWVGIGEHRPTSKESKTGSFGRWEVVPGDRRLMA